MNFKNGDLAVIVSGPWKEAVGRIVKIIWRCREFHGKGVAADGLQYWLDGGAPIYLVRPVNNIALPAGSHTGEVLYRLKRRPYCGCWMRPLLRAEIALGVMAEKNIPVARENTMVEETIK